MAQLNSIIIEGELTKNTQKELFETTSNYVLLSEKCSIGVEFKERFIKSVSLNFKETKKKSISVRLVGFLSGSYGQVVFVAEHIEFKKG